MPKHPTLHALLLATLVSCREACREACQGTCLICYPRMSFDMYHCLNLAWHKWNVTCQCLQLGQAAVSHCTPIMSIAVFLAIGCIIAHQYYRSYHGIILATDHPRAHGSQISVNSLINVAPWICNFLSLPFLVLWETTFFFPTCPYLIGSTCWLD